MTTLAPGTLCFLVNLVEMVECRGRVVEVRTGPTFDPLDGEFKYSVDAAWIREEFPGSRGALASRGQLRPIVPPQPAAPAKKRAAPEKVGS